MMASASPSPRSPEVTEKSKKYDRQLRLWGDHGQSRLEKSHVCIINANATGTEILKSLVLPGVKKFTIIDGNKVSQEDIGTNFFLDVECLGKSRAECTTKLLLELNTDVVGDFIEDNPETLLKNNPDFFNDKFTVVIGIGLSERLLIALSQTLWDCNVPFVSVHSIGFIGWIRMQFNEHTIIESHPDNIIEDLRLEFPFPELVDHMNIYVLSKAPDDKNENVGDIVDPNVVKDKDGKQNGLSKTPWLVLLYKAIESYIHVNSDVQNGNEMETDQMESVKRHPCQMSSKQKQEFKIFLQTYLKALGLTEIKDDSFTEALKAVNTALTPIRIPTEVMAILDDPKATKPEKSKFWTMCGALKEFVHSNNGQLPVRGVLPDMTADSAKYIELQNIYRRKAAKDADDVLTKSQEILNQTHEHDISILEEDVRLFCKESHNLRIIRGYPLYKELLSSPTEVLKELAQNTEDCDQERMYYVMLRGLLRFQADYNTYPGVLDNDVEPDIARFKTVMNKLLNEWTPTIILREEYMHEICRYGASELPSVAAFVGGCAAQEVIKIITKQYIPLDNTCIYNAMQSTTSSFKITEKVQI